MYFCGPSAVLVHLDAGVKNGDAQTLAQWERALHEFRHRSRQPQRRKNRANSITTSFATATASSACNKAATRVADSVVSCSKVSSTTYTLDSTAQRRPVLTHAKRTSYLNNTSIHDRNDNILNNGKPKSQLGDSDSGSNCGGDNKTLSSDTDARVTAIPSRRRNKSVGLDDFFHVSHELEMLKQTLCQVPAVAGAGGNSCSGNSNHNSMDDGTRNLGSQQRRSTEGDGGEAEIAGDVCNAFDPMPISSSGTYAQAEATTRGTGLTELVNEVLDSDEDASAASRALCNEAAQLFRADCVREALAIYTRLSQDASVGQQSAAVVNNMAACYFRLEDWPSCLRATRRALDMSPTLRVARRRLVRVHLALNQLSEAKAVLAAPEVPHTAGQVMHSTEMSKVDGSSPRTVSQLAWAAEAACVQAYERYVNLYDIRQYELAMTELNGLLRCFPCGTLEAHKVQLLSLESMSDALAYAEVQVQRYATCASLRYWKAELQFQLAESTSDLQAVLAELGETSPSAKHGHTHNTHSMDGRGSDLTCGSSAHEKGSVKMHEEPRMRLVATRVRECLKAMTETERLMHASAWHDVIAYCTSLLNATLPTAALTSPAKSFTPSKHYADNTARNAAGCIYHSSTATSSASSTATSMCRRSVARTAFSTPTFLGEGVRGFLYTARATAYVHTRQWYYALDDIHHTQRCLATVSSSVGSGSSTCTPNPTNTAPSRARAKLLLLTALTEEGLHRANDAAQHARQSLQLHFTSEATQLLSRLDARQRAEAQHRGEQEERQKSQRQGRGGPFSRPRQEEKQQQQKQGAHSAPRKRALDTYVRERCFDLLAVPTTADERTVRQAYRALAMRWHPDRWCGTSDKEVAHAEVTFKEVQNAYEVVMNTFDLA